MKKNIFFVAAVLTLLFGCEKPDSVKTNEEINDSCWYFVSEKPAFDDATKTAWTGEKVEWMPKDQIRVGCYNSATNKWQDKDGDETNGAKVYSSNQLAEENIVNGIATFEFPISSQFTMSDGNYRFYSFYPNTLNGGNSDFSSAPVINASISSAQNISADSFTSSSDILVGVSSATYSTKPTIQDSDRIEVELKWKRLVAFPVITFKNLNGAVSGEKVNSVKITAQDGAALTGAVDVNIYDGTIAASESRVSYNYVSATSSTGVALDDNNSFTTWFTTLPFEATSLDVEIVTDKATYTRSIDLKNSLVFERNKRNILAINMSSASRAINDDPINTKYVKVTSTSDLTDGKYLIIYEAGKVALNGALTADAEKNTVQVTIINDEISSNSTIDAAAVTYSALDGTFLGYGGKYIGHTGTSNTLNYSDEALANVVTFDSGNAVISAGDNYVMRYNKTSGQERFRYYKSGQEAVQLYKYVAGCSVFTEQLPAPTNLVCLNSTENSLSFTWNSVVNAIGYQVSLDNGSTYLTTQTETSYSWNGLTSSTKKTIYVKAIGDGTNYSDSDAVSAEGTTSASSGSGQTVTLFTEGFGDNSNSARNWDDSYKEQGGINTVYSNAVYSMINIKQGKNTTGSKASGINQSTTGSDAVFELGPLNVSGYTDLQLSYKWKAASIKGTYYTKVYYKTSQSGVYTEIATTGTGATTFVNVNASLPAAANGLSTLYLKIVFNTSNTQAIIDEVKLTGKN